MIISTSNGSVFSETNALDVTALRLEQSSNVNFDVLKLLVGNEFEGLITDVLNNQVTIQIKGQNLMAHIDESVNLNIGQRITFKVQTNDGIQVSIKPMMTVNNENQIFAKVLTQANLPLTEQNFQMVQTMMDEKLPVDKKNVQEMFRQVSQFPKENVTTIVQMVKLELPITQENIVQFENYKNMEHQIDKTMNQVIEEFLPLLSDSWNEIANAPKELLDSQGATTSPKELLNLQTTMFESFQVQERDQTLCREIFNPKELENLANKMENIGISTEVLKEVKSGNITSQELISQLKQAFESMEENTLPKEELGKLFSSKEYQGLLKDSMSNNWFIRPEDLKQENKIEDMYKKLYSQIKQMGDMVEKVGKEDNSLSKNLISIKSNLEFMNQVNHVMNYVQIPLKMLNQKAHSDLYVFTNKKSLAQNNGKLSALLHLDMDALGPLDIYVQMEDQKVNTQFHVEDEASMDLIMENAHLLTSRLEDKGYQCTVEMKEREKAVDFVEDFLKQEQPGNKLQRYSFDVRA